MLIVWAALNLVTAIVFAVIDPGGWWLIETVVILVLLAGLVALLLAAPSRAWTSRRHPGAAA